MNWPRKFLLLLAAIIVAGALALGVRNYAQRQAWQRMRPELPALVGAEAPGLDARLAADVSRLQVWPPDLTALAEYARLCHANGLLEPATTGYQALVILEPGEARWPHLLASILAGYGRLDEALPLLRRTTQLAPDYLVAWLRLGSALFKANDIAGAEAAYQAALTRAPGNSYALLGLARCDLQLERWTAARSHLQQAVASDPTSGGAQSLLASVFDRLGNPAGAALARTRMENGGLYIEPTDAWLDELTAYCHNPYTLLTAASSTVADGRVRQALPALERALSLAPDDARIRRQLAKVRFALGDPVEARAQMERAVALAPGDENMRFDLVDLMRKMKDHEALSRAVAAGLAACPTSTAMQFEAGLLAVEAWQMDEAESHFQFAWQNRPDNPSAARALADVYFRTNRSEAGLEVLEKIIARKPQVTVLHVELVEHGIELRDPRTAGWLRRAIDSGSPELPSAELKQNYRRRFGVELQ